MGNQDEGVFVVLEIPGKPLDVLRIQVVGGFVQQQDVRVLQQQLGEQHLGPLAPDSSSTLCSRPMSRSPSSATFFVFWHSRL